jgi:hypothetical protein
MGQKTAPLRRERLLRLMSFNIPRYARFVKALRVGLLVVLGDARFRPGKGVFGG